MNYYIAIEESAGAVVKHDLADDARFKLDFGEDGTIIRVWDDSQLWIVPMARLVAVCLPNLSIRR